MNQTRDKIPKKANDESILHSRKSLAPQNRTATSKNGLSEARRSVMSPSIMSPLVIGNAQIDIPKTHKIENDNKPPATSLKQ